MMLKPADVRTVLRQTASTQTGCSDFNTENLRFALDLEFSGVNTEPCPQACLAMLQDTCWHANKNDFSE